MVKEYRHKILPSLTYPGSSPASGGMPGWMNALTFGRDVAPLGRDAGCHGLCPWGSTRKTLWPLTFLTIQMTFFACA
jgi:hypothetical protein